ncbi:hypothetical protein Tco_0580563 [Tanacetum coccineum]
MKRGFLSQKGDGGGRVVKEKQQSLDNNAKKDTVVVSLSTIDDLVVATRNTKDVNVGQTPTSLTVYLKSGIFNDHHFNKNTANNLPLRGGHSIVDPSCDVLSLGALYSWEFLLKFHLHACDLGS